MLKFHEIATVQILWLCFSGCGWNTDVCLFIGASLYLKACDLISHVPVEKCLFWNLNFFLSRRAMDRIMDALQIKFERDLWWESQGFVQFCDPYINYHLWSNLTSTYQHTHNLRTLLWKYKILVHFFSILNLQLYCNKFKILV